MTTLFTDNFNRTENPIASGWAKQSGIGTSLQTNGTQAKGITAGSDNVAVFDSAIADDQFSEAVLVAAADDGGPWVRGSTSASQGYLYDLPTASSASGIFKYNGSFTLLGANFGVGNIAGHIYRIEAKGQGSTNLEAFDNVISQAVRTDASSPHLSGRAGLHCFDTAIAWDSWQAGDFSVAGGQAIGSNSWHPGRSPGLGGISSARFQTNWWPYSPPVAITFDPAFMAAMEKMGNDPLVLPPQVVASGMTPPNNVPS